MIEVKEGPGAVLPDYDGGRRFDVSFRVVTSYQIATDTAVTRFDVLLNMRQEPNPHGLPPHVIGDQLNFAITTSKPGDGALKVPGAVMGGYVFETHAASLAAGLRGLADAIERKMTK